MSNLADLLKGVQEAANRDAIDIAWLKLRVEGIEEQRKALEAENILLKKIIAQGEVLLAPNHTLKLPFKKFSMTRDDIPVTIGTSTAGGNDAL